MTHLKFLPKITTNLLKKLLSINSKREWPSMT